MGDTIDKRIVEMAFENDKFEKGVGTSLGTIDKLKKSLNFENASKSLSGLTDAANRVNLGNIANGVQNISSHFSAMGILAITTLANIANSAYQAGARIVKALTIDPISTGLNEYETKLNSVQTILANTQKEGTTLKIVTDALNRLNEYSDKTIYNFQQMTRNVGTFTAAGVKLETSVAAIKGIANLAAISGSNADQASTAMYQLSQALSSGTVKLMDWNSVVNAGMGGQVFQDAIKETARLHGVAIDDMIKQEGSFRETLQKGWFTSEILTETLAKFTGDLNAEQLKTMGYTEEQIASIIKMGQTANDAATKVKTFTQLFDTLKEAAQSGWAQTWEILIGDFEEAKLFLTDLNNWFGGILGATADARNEMLQGWKDLGGRSKMLESFKNILNAIVLVINPIKQGFREIFPATTSKQLLELTENIKKFTDKLLISSENADKVKRIFKGVFALLDIGRMAISALVKSVFGLSSGLGAPIASLTDFLARMGDFIVKMRDGLKSSDAFNKVIKNIGDFIKPVIKFIIGLFSSITEGVESLKNVKLDGISNFFDKLKVRFEPLSKIFNLAGKFIELIGKALTVIGPIFLKLGGVIADGVSSFVDKIMKGLDSFDPDKVFDIVNGGLLAGILLAIKKFVDKGSSAFDGIKDVLDSVKGSLQAWQATLKADVLFKIAAALGILTLSIVALSMIDSKKLTTALAAISVMFVQLGLALTSFQKISSQINPIAMGTMAVGLIAISGAILLMSVAVSKLSKLNPKELVNGLLAITVLIIGLKASASTLSTSSGQMITGAAALLVFSFAIRSLVVAVKKLGDIDVDSLTKGLAGVGILLTELALFLKVTDLSGMGMIKAVGIFVLAGAIMLLTTAVGKLAKIDDAGIQKGLLAIGVIFTEIGAFIALTGGAPGLIVVATGVGILSLSMLVMADALGTLGKMSWEEIAKSLTIMAGALTLIGAAAYLIPPTLIVTAAGLVVVAGALVILADAMSSMGGMSWDEVGRGLTVLAGSLLILTVGLTAMSGTLGGSAALLLAAGALAILAPALKALGSMSWEEIGKGLVALAGAFVVLGAAGYILTPIIPSLLGLGAAMVLVGIGAAGVGVGLLAFSAGLAALAVTGSAGAAALVLVLTSLIGLIPMVIKQVGKGLLLLIDILVAGAPTLLKGIVTLLNILLDGLLEVVPKIIDVVFTVLDDLLTALAEKTPELVEAGYTVLISLLEGIRNNIGTVVELSYEIIEEFLKGVANKLPDMVESGWNLIISWVDAMTGAVEENIPAFMHSVRLLGIAIVKGMLIGLSESREDAVNGIMEIGKVIVDSFKNFLGIHSPSSVFMELARMIILGLIQGIQNGINSVMITITNLANDMLNSLSGKYQNMVSAGRDLVSGFAEGITSYIGTAVSAAANLAQSVLNKVKSVMDSNSPSKKMIDEGKNIDDGLAVGITQFSGVVTKSVDRLGNDTLGKFSSVLSKVSDSVNSNMDFSPTIRPVVDLTDIQTSGSLIQGIFDAASVSVGLASSTAKSIDKTEASNNIDTSAQTTTDQKNPLTFIQNNYSPKELSRVEIYRQTRLQLLQAKG